MSDSDSSAKIVFSAIKIDTPQSEKPHYYPEKLSIIMEEDPDWVPELSGKAIYRLNKNNENVEFIHYNNIDVPVNTFDQAFHNRHEVEVYLPFGTNYEVLPAFGTGQFHRKFSEEFEIMEMTEIVKIKDSIVLPICQHVIPHKDSRDAVLELYDYPFTMLPLEHSCKAFELGHSPKFVGPCNYMEEGNFKSCSSYQPFEQVTVARMDNTDVTLDRIMSNGTIAHEYKWKDTIFESFNDLKEWAEENKLQFEVIWSPISQPVSFLDKVVGRLKVTYPHEKV